MKQKLGLAVAIGVTLILGASAVQAADNGFYLGAGAGLSTASTDTAGSIAITEFFGGTATSTSTDDSDMAVRIFAGYSFSKHIGVELNYADLGESSVTVQDDVNSLTDVYKFAVSGFGISAIGSLPITDKFSVFGKLGIFSWASDITANVDFGGGLIVSTKVSESGTAPMIGIGAAYRFTNNFGVRGEIEHIAIDKEDAGAGDFNVITASAVFRF